MELKAVALAKQAFQLIGLVVCLLLFMNGIVDFWYRHDMSGELGLRSDDTQYAYQAPQSGRHK